jgi:hypothetical protein
MSTTERNKGVVTDFIDGLFTKGDLGRAAYDKVGVGSRRELVTALLRGSP